jgi:hypothetical protein
MYMTVYHPEQWSHDLHRHKEKQEYNQYWYSESTIDVLCQVSADTAEEKQK